MRNVIFLLLCVTPCSAIAAEIEYCPKEIVAQSQQLDVPEGWQYNNQEYMQHFLVGVSFYSSEPKYLQRLKYSRFTETGNGFIASYDFAMEEDVWIGCHYFGVTPFISRKLSDDLSGCKVRQIAADAPVKLECSMR